jgi:hypothetical protein
MNLPLQSITTASCGTEMPVPTATIFPLRMTSVAFWILVCASFTIVALVKAYAPSRLSATPFSGKVGCENPAVDMSRNEMKNASPASEELFLIAELFFSCEEVSASRDKCPNLGNVDEFI